MPTDTAVEQELLIQTWGTAACASIETSDGKCFQALIRKITITLEANRLDEVVFEMADGSTRTGHLKYEHDPFTTAPSQFRVVIEAATMAVAS